MSEHTDPNEKPNEEDALFDEIRSFLDSQSGEEIYDDIQSSFNAARVFTNRDLRKMDEFTRMIRALERLIEKEYPNTFDATMRTRLAESFYMYGLAHYSLLNQSSDDAGNEEEESGADHASPSPLIIYDIWFPQDIAIENAQDGFYLHLSDGRIDLSLYLGSSPNERGALVDLVDHWGYSAASGKPAGELEPTTTRITPVLTVELDYNGTELVDADDHVDILFLDGKGEPIVRVHARTTDLRMLVDELQATEQNEDS